MPEPFESEINLFLRRGGILRARVALRDGISARALYQMRDTGVVEQLSRGLYRLADLPALSNPDLVTVAAKVPSGVICLVSALAYHEITTQIPHEVHVALPRGAEPPRLQHPPLRAFWFTGKAFTEGIEPHEVDGMRLRVYSPEKTLADCFKYRNKLGLDVFLEALKLYLAQKRPRIDQVTKYAAMCRVERLMRPYLEALLYSP
jgi:predicted transcriptional regulator of viral defense system